MVRMMMARGLVVGVLSLSCVCSAYAQPSPPTCVAPPTSRGGDSILTYVDVRPGERLTLSALGEGTGGGEPGGSIGVVIELDGSSRPVADSGNLHVGSFERHSVDVSTGPLDVSQGRHRVEVKWKNPENVYRRSTSLRIRVGTNCPDWRPQ